jgi:D-lactate dehydrogenase
VAVIVFYEATKTDVGQLTDGLRDTDHHWEFVHDTINMRNLNHDAEVISVFVASQVTRQMLEKMPRLKLIATRSTGFDHIDMQAATAKGIIVTNVPTYGENTVAEFTFALILALSRKIYPAIKRVHEQGLFSYEGLRGFDLKGKIIGVIGTGKIGARVIKIAQGFEMEVLAYDPHPREDLGIKYATLEDLLKKSDIISIHVPYMPATHHLINEENLKLVKPTAILINTSRGGLVDTMALLTSLKQKQLAGAGLDVLEEEGYIIDELNLLKGHPNEEQLKTILADHELMQMDNVVVTPHNAFNTQEAMNRILDTTVLNIQAFLRGQPINLVKKDV